MTKKIYLNKKSNQILLDLTNAYGIDILNKQELWLNLKDKNNIYMPLNIEKNHPNIFSINHYFVQNGDMMMDPDMEFLIKKLEINQNNENDLAMQFRIFPLTFRQDSLNVTIKSAELNDKENIITRYNPTAQDSAVDFADMWFENLKDQYWYLEQGKPNPEKEILNINQ